MVEQINKWLNDNRGMNCKLYRCGWCGSFCDKHGGELTQSQWEQVENDLADDKIETEVVLIDGDCCKHEFYY